MDGWHLRYVVLDQQARLLHYYIKETDNLPRKTIDLTQVTLVNITEKESKKNHAGFRLLGGKGCERLLFISADRKSCNEWVSAITAVQSGGSPNENLTGKKSE